MKNKGVMKDNKEEIQTKIPVNPGLKNVQDFNQEENNHKRFFPGTDVLGKSKTCIWY